MGIGYKQPGDVFEKGLQGSALAVAEIIAQNQVIPGFFQGTLRNVEKPILIWKPTFLEAFRNISRN
ncbi:MAG TPA: hypothetical protein VGH55_08020 [Chthoniobacterales bacterium]